MLVRTTRTFNHRFWRLGNANSPCLQNLRPGLEYEDINAPDGTVWIPSRGRYQLTFLHTARRESITKGACLWSQPIWGGYPWRSSTEILMPAGLDFENDCVPSKYHWSIVPTKAMKLHDYLEVRDFMWSLIVIGFERT